MEDGTFAAWDDRYSVKIQPIDDQRKPLINITNALYEGCLAGDGKGKGYFMETVHGTVDYVKCRFAVENEKHAGHIML